MAYFGPYYLNNYSLFTQWDSKLSTATNLIIGARQDINRGNRIEYGTQNKKSPLLSSSLYLKHQLDKGWAATFSIDNLFNRQDIISNDTNSTDYYTMGRTFKLGISFDF